MHDAVPFARRLSVRRLDDRTFRGASEDASPQRGFGGLLMAHALAAACATVQGERAMHALAARFLRPVDSTQPVDYVVHDASDTRNFSRRAIRCVQGDKVMLELSASFVVPLSGPQFQLPMPQVPPPEELVSERVDPIDVRHVEGEAVLQGQLREPSRQRVWMRASDSLPGDPALHACALAYLSDLTILWLALSANGLDVVAGRHTQLASLEHTLWVHRPFRADAWLLYDQQCVATGGGLALCRGELFTRDGQLVASVAQTGRVST